MMSLLRSLKRQWHSMRTTIREIHHQPAYRVIAIEQNDTEEYIATVQVSHKAHIFKIRPEEILADDAMTDGFSPRDIRTLTYLGYLGIHAPKYKLLAKRLSDNDEKLIFAIQERGKKKPVIRTADEISTNEELLKGLDQKDAHLIGYTSASEREATEKAHMKNLLKQRKTTPKN